MKTDARPHRFISEFTEEEADDIAEKLLDSNSFASDLRDFLRGATDPQQYLYELQVRVENVVDEIRRDQAEARLEYAADLLHDQMKEGDV